MIAVPQMQSKVCIGKVVAKNHPVALLHPLTVSQWAEWLLLLEQWSGTAEEEKGYTAKLCVCPKLGQRLGHNSVLQICICPDERGRERATYRPGLYHHQYYPSIRQPWFLKLLISEIFFSPTFTQGFLDLPSARIWCVDSMDVGNNSLCNDLKCHKCRQCYNLNPLQHQRFTALLVENHVSLSASNVFFPLQKSGGDNTTKVFEIHVNLT